MPRRLLAEHLGSLLLAALVIGSGIAAQRLSPDDVGLQLLENAAAGALAELGLDITAEVPSKLTTEDVEASDVVITMGCGDTCPSSPASATSTGTSKTPPAKASTPSAPSATTSPAASAPCSPSSWTGHRRRLPR